MTTNHEAAAALFDEDVKHWQEVAHYANGVADLAMKHRDIAEDENARLEAALREIIALGDDPYIEPPNSAIEIARAALDTQTGGWDE
jgi:hypothetical protein